MPKKIFLLLLLFWGAAWNKAAWADPQIYAYLYDASSNTSVQGGTNCAYLMAIELGYSLNETPSNAYVGGDGACLLAVSASGDNLGCAGDFRIISGLGAVSEASGLWNEPCDQHTTQELEQLQKTAEAQAVQAQYYLEGYVGTLPNGSPQTLIKSNIAQLVNPITAPIGLYGSHPGSDLISSVNRTITSDPVNIATGEAYFSSTDFNLQGRGPKLELFRQYGSLSNFIGMFGYGWRTDFDANLTVDGSGNVIIYDAKGVGEYFLYTLNPIIGGLPPSYSYIPSPGNHSTIVKNPDNTYTVTDKHGIITHYDINGRLSSRTDRNGNALTFVYNPSVPGGTYIQDASGRRITLNIDFHGHVISAVDPAGNVFQYGYDTNGNLVSITDPDQAVTNYYYDGNHKIYQFTNANNHNRYYQYDGQGRVIANYQDNNVNKVTLNYEANNTTVITDSLNNSNTYVFNSYGLLLSRTDPLNNLTKETWDTNLNRTSITDARRNTTAFSYDTQGNLVQIVDPYNNKTNMSYTSNFNLLSSRTDAMNQSTNFIYDIQGNLTTIIDANRNSRHFVYDQYGDLISVTDTLGNTTNFTYDAFSHIIQKTDALGHNTGYAYE